MSQSLRSQSSLSGLSQEAITRKLDHAHGAANACEWTGDIRVNFLTAHKAAKVLSDRVRELEVENEQLQDLLKIAIDNQR